jgi:hypothetical protein
VTRTRCTQHGQATVELALVGMLMVTFLLAIY